MASTALRAYHHRTGRQGDQVTRRPANRRCAPLTTGPTLRAYSPTDGGGQGHARPAGTHTGTVGTGQVMRRRRTAPAASSCRSWRRPRRSSRGRRGDGRRLTRTVRGVLDLPVAGPSVRRGGRTRVQSISDGRTPGTPWPFLGDGAAELLDHEGNDLVARALLVARDVDAGSAHSDESATPAALMTGSSALAVSVCKVDSRFVGPSADTTVSAPWTSSVSAAGRCWHRSRRPHGRRGCPACWVADQYPHGRAPVEQVLDKGRPVVQWRR